MQPPPIPDSLQLKVSRILSKLDTPTVKWLMVVMLIFTIYSCIPKQRSLKNCFRSPNDSMEDSIEELVSIVPDEGIFFVDTTCIQSMYGVVVLHDRHMCAIESAARLHPDRNIYVILTSRKKFNRISYHRRHIVFQPVTDYENIRFVFVNYNTYVKNPPLGETLPFYNSDYADVQANDILRSDNRLNTTITIILFLIVTIIAFDSLLSSYRIRNSDIYCIGYVGAGEDEVLMEVGDLKPDNSIFMVNTQCDSFVQGRLDLPTRHLCAIEAAALLNPDKNVVILIAAPVLIKLNLMFNSDRILSNVFSYRNVKFMHVTFGKYFKDTALQRLVSAGRLYSSSFSVSHANQLIRLVTLYKYGGVALDMNMLLLKNIGQLGLNYAGIDADGYVSNNILSLSSDIKGREVAENLMYEIAENYDPKLWNSAGGKALTSVIKKKCGRDGNITYEDMKNCTFLNLLDRKIFYPLEAERWVRLFDKREKTILNDLRNSYAIQNWEISYMSNISVKTPFGKLVQRFCPKVFSLSNGKFL